MSDNPRTIPSRATRAEEVRDAKVQAGPDEPKETQLPRDNAPVDEDVAEHYEEMTERGASQPGEGRLP